MRDRRAIIVGTGTACFIFRYIMHGMSTWSGGTAVVRMRDANKGVVNLIVFLVINQG